MAKLTPFNKIHSANEKAEAYHFDLIDSFLNNGVSRDIDYDTFKIDIKDEDTKYTIDAELPGLTKDQILIKYDNNLLNIAITYEDEVESNDNNYIHKERQTCSMARTIQLRDIDKSKITARLVDGILKIDAPKLDEILNTSTTIEIE